MRYLPKHLIPVVLRSVLIPLLFALIMAIVWDLLDWMRNYGSGVPLIPHLTNLPEHLFDSHSNKYYFSVDNFINWYNFTFLGAAHFGTALGIVLGGIYVFCNVRSLEEKYIAAIIVGSIIGGRIGLLFSSSSHIFLGGLLAGAIIGGLRAFTFRHSTKEIKEFSLLKAVETE